MILQERLYKSTVEFRSRLQILFDDLLCDPNTFDLIRTVQEGGGGGVYSGPINSEERTSTSL